MVDGRARPRAEAIEPQRPQEGDGEQNRQPADPDEQCQPQRKDERRQPDPERDGPEADRD